MNGTDLYTAQKKFMVTWLRTLLKVKIRKHEVKKAARREKIIDIFNTKDALTVANFFSYLRIIFAFLIILALNSVNNVLILSLFTFGMLTDWLDGIFTDVYNEATEIGKILDPTADKFLIIGALWPFKNILIWLLFDAHWFLQPIYILIYFEFSLLITASIKPYINRRFDLNFLTGANI